MPRKFPFYKQLDAMDCGATCLRMIARFYGRYYSLDHLRELTHLDREGVSLMGISDAAESIGMHSLAVKIGFDRLADDIPLPCIAHWRQNHFICVHKVSKTHVWVADPAAGKFKITREEFMEGWISDTDEGEDVGVLLLLETTPAFFDREDDKVDRSGFRFLLTYVLKYRKLLGQLFLGLLIGSVLQLVFPFLMQAIVDIGIVNQNINFVVLVLVAQLVLFVSQTAVEFIRGWILLHIGVRVNINLISDFLIKMMRLPIRFFDTKMTGDLLQRIYDNQRVERFLTSASLITMFSLLNFGIFGFVLAYYDVRIFAIFFIATVIYVIWIVYFLRRRKALDYRRFDQMAENQSNLIQLIGGMKEIKLHNAEKQKRWQWERIQAKLFRVSMDYLAVDQWQRSGASFINESKNIVISFIAAKAVIDGVLSLGEMLAIQYIIGQLNGPIEQLVGFIRSYQDAKISLERMNEIHSREEEAAGSDMISILPEDHDLYLNNVSFQYGGPHSPMILRDISLHFPEGKTTAIVGTSGSGKTTILKLLLNFYRPTQGVIRLGDINLGNLQNRIWRGKCGVVMQDGYIFSESIAKNIALGDEVIDKRKLLKAVKVANIQSFIEGLPLGYNTKVGDDGVGLSQGQRQRILIARAVYKDPEYIFFDEATNALDAYNEMIIMDNLEEFFRGRTVLVVAHRLSTVKNADNIIVLEKGEVIEQGNHEQLTAMKGAYYYLVKNQLELGA
ncbi:MAG: peptidase domain-containing ABC transporter [Bacteroidota bacterium]